MKRIGGWVVFGKLAFLSSSDQVTTSGIDPTMMKLGQRWGVCLPQPHETKTPHVQNRRDDVQRRHPPVVLTWPPQHPQRSPTVTSGKLVELIVVVITSSLG